MNWRYFMDIGVWVTDDDDSDYSNIAVEYEVGANLSASSYFMIPEN